MEREIMVYVALIEGGRFNTHDVLYFSTAESRAEYIDNHEWYDTDIRYLERKIIVKEDMKKVNKKLNELKSEVGLLHDPVYEAFLKLNYGKL